MTGRALIVAWALVAAACGGEASEADVDGAADQTAPSTSTTADAGSAPADAPTPESTTSTTSVATTLAATGPPAVAAITSGRGDDDSLEIGIWFNSNPFQSGDVRIMVGTDSNGSFPGSGDPVPHIDGWANLTGVGVVLLDGGETIADASTGDLNEWLSWTGPGRAMWIYFMRNVPVRAGTVWVVLEIDGEVVSGGVAGAPFGSGCSYHSAGIDLGPVPGDVPDFGAPCRYPRG